MQSMGRWVTDTKSHMGPWGHADMRTVVSERQEQAFALFLFYSDHFLLQLQSVIFHKNNFRESGP